MSKGTDKNCIFCKIISGEINTEFVYKDKDFVAIKDISPKARIHYLVMPVSHVSTLNDVTDQTIYSGLLSTAVKIAKEQGFADDGYRLILNCNSMGGQSVYHVHLHILAGEQMYGF